MNYLVKSHLKHNGKEYFEGDDISLADKYVEPLIERGVIEPVEEDESESEKVESEAEGVEDYSEMSWRELQSLASERSVLKAGMTKEDVIEALRE